MCVARCSRCCRILVWVLSSAVSALSKHKQPVCRVVIVRVKGSRSRLRFTVSRRCAVGHVLWLRRNCLWLLWWLALWRIELVAFGSRGHRRAMKVNSARCRSATGKLSKKCLGVGAWSREHRPASTRRQSRPQRRFVGCRKPSSQVVSITKVIIRWPR